MKRFSFVFCCCCFVKTFAEIDWGGWSVPIFVVVVHFYLSVRNKKKAKTEEEEEEEVKEQQVDDEEFPRWTWPRRPPILIRRHGRDTVTQHPLYGAPFFFSFFFLVVVEIFPFFCRFCFSFRLFRVLLLWFFLRRFFLVSGWATFYRVFAFTEFRGGRPTFFTEFLPSFVNGGAG